MFPASRLVELGKVFHIQHYPMSVSRVLPEGDIVFKEN